MIRAILIVSLIAVVCGQEAVNGTCPPGLKNSNLTQLGGVWYEKQRIPITDFNSDCGKWEIRTISDTTASLEYTRRSEGNLVAVTGNITKTVVPDDLAIFTITNLFNETRDYFVVETDYTNSLVLYSCRNAGNQSTIWAWKLSKNQTAEWVSNSAIDAAIAATPGLQAAAWQNVNQTACSGSIAIVASPILAIVAFFFATKDSLFSR